LEKLSRFDVADISGCFHGCRRKRSAATGSISRRHPTPSLLSCGEVFEPHYQTSDQELVLATRLIAAVRRSHLRRMGHVGKQGDDVIRAVDVLMAGV